MTPNKCKRVQEAYDKSGADNWTACEDERFLKQLKTHFSYKNGLWHLVTSQGPSPTGATVQNCQEAKPFPLVSVISHVFASVTGCRELSEEIFLGKFRTTKNRKTFKLYYAMRLMWIVAV